MKKIFGELNLSWKTIIISAIVIGVSVGLLNSIPILKETSFTDPAIYFDVWILFGLLIIANSHSNKEAALKCFIFFLISQPLIYLVEVPFSSMGWQLFVYYKTWFIWTIFTIPMGFLGYYMKKDKWWGLLILAPLIILLGYGVSTHLGNLIFEFPRHILSYLFCVCSLIIYPLYMFNDKKVKTAGLIISILVIIGFSATAIINASVYSTNILCSGEKYDFDETYDVYFKDSKYGTAYIEKIDSIDAYCVHTDFKKAGKTEFILESPSGDKKVFNLIIAKNTYKIKEIKN